MNMFLLIQLAFLQPLIFMIQKTLIIFFLSFLFNCSITMMKSYTCFPFVFYVLKYIIFFYFTYYFLLSLFLFSFSFFFPFYSPIMSWTKWVIFRATENLNTMTPFLMHLWDVCFYPYWRKWIFKMWSVDQLEADDTTEPSTCNQASYMTCIQASYIQNDSPSHAHQHQFLENFSIEWYN